MKQKLLLIMALTAMTLAAEAQRIDFCAINRSDAECLEPGYQKWAFDRVASATGTFTADDGSKISITVSAVEGLAGNAVRSNHWKATVQAGFKLTGDACYVGYMPNLGVNNDFENITAGSSGVQLVIEGLKEGPHSLMAYHNMIEGVGSAPSPLKVVVNGQTLAEGIQQTIQKKQTADCGQSYVMFSAKDGETVTVQYISTPQDGQDYSWTGVALNALIFDDINLAATASEPVPANEDYHVDADDGTYTLSWRAAEGAVRHHVLMGTSATDLQELGTTTENSFAVDGLKNINFYYWRVDEEMADGTRYPGIVWSFRPRHLAFPGAEGYGRYANGGRGGIVYHVTNLSDDGQPGSFRYGLEKLKGPRTIVFDVSGFIALGGKLTSGDSFVTVAGQTAPGKGICFGRAVIGFGSDHIVRHIRNRVGSGTTYDGMGFRSARESIMDHCSISWSIDEGFSSREAGNITLQRTLISEALNVADHDKYDEGSRHGFAAVFGGDIGSFHHNLLANNSGRNPRLDGGMDANGYYMGRLDIFNNVVYNWNSHPSYGEAHEANFHRNFYKMGPATTRKWILIADVNQRGSNKGTESYYMHNVLVDKNHKIIFDGTKHGNGTNTNVDGGKWQLVNPMTVDWNPWVDEPFFPSYATVETAYDAYKTVLSDVGCNQPVIDDHDQRQIHETQTGTNKYKGSKTGLAGLPDTEEDVGGWELYPEETRPDNFDTDQDGMPDWWEHLVDSNPTDADSNSDPDGDGYTLLEDYLNFMGEPHLVLAPGTQATVDVAKLFAGFTKEPQYTAEITGTAATCSLAGNTLTVKGSGTEGLTTIMLTVTDAEGSTCSRQLNVAVSGVGSQTAVRSITEEDIVCYELFDLNGRCVEGSPQRGTVYLMRATDRWGQQHTFKAVKN